MVLLKNLWNFFRPEYFTSYPYERIFDVGPRPYSDIYQRSISRLVASLAHFGELVRIGDAQLDATLADANEYNQKIPLVTRILSDSTRPDDFPQLFPQFLPVTEDNRLVLDAQMLFDKENDFPDLTLYEQIIFHRHINEGKWAIFVVVLPWRKKLNADKTQVIVEGFFIGGVELDDVDDIFLPIISTLGRYFPIPMVEWRRRCHIPVTFSNDNVFFTFLLIYYLHNDGNYLDLTPESVLLHKFQAFPGIERHHDLWLGKLQVDQITTQSHPFVQPVARQTNLSDFERLGWLPIDVRGDGNCGYYSLILGLENIGYFTYSVGNDDDDSASNSQRPKQTKRRKVSHSMKDNIQWQKQIFDMRRKLQEHSNWLLAVQYPRSRRNYSDLMWSLSGAVTDVQADGTAKELAELEAANEEARKKNKNLEIEKTIPLSNQFLMEGAQTRDYFTNKFREDQSDFHMNPYWAPHVLASSLELRVIVYMMDSSVPKDLLRGKLRLEILRNHK